MAHLKVVVVAPASGLGPWSLLSMFMLILLLVQPHPVDAYYVSYEKVPAYAQGERYVIK
jgi:hypothetical protein